MGSPPGRLVATRTKTVPRVRRGPGFTPQPLEVSSALEDTFARLRPGAVAGWCAGSLGSAFNLPPGVLPVTAARSWSSLPEGFPPRAG